MSGNNQKTNADRIRDFHAGAGAPFPDAPLVPETQMLILRKTLIDEEYAEVTAEYNRLINAQSANQPHNITQLVHELADLLYVAYGAILACGVDADAVFAEVHRANMQKLDGPRRADGKLLKPPGWQPANVGAVIARLQNSKNGNQ